MLYILDEDNEPVEVEDPIEWHNWMMENQDRVRVGKDEIGDSFVSTVFLGIDLSSPWQPQILFETMIFGGRLNMEGSRYETWEEAKEGHERLTQKATAVLAN